MASSEFLHVWLASLEERSTVGFRVRHFARLRGGGARGHALARVTFTCQYAAGRKRRRAVEPPAGDGDAPAAPARPRGDAAAVVQPPGALGEEGEGEAAAGSGGDGGSVDCRLGCAARMQVRVTCLDDAQCRAFGLPPPSVRFEVTVHVEHCSGGGDGGGGGGLESRIGGGGPALHVPGSIEDARRARPARAVREACLGAVRECTHARSPLFHPRAPSHPRVRARAAR